MSYCTNEFSMTNINMICSISQYETGYHILNPIDTSAWHTFNPVIANGNSSVLYIAPHEYHDDYFIYRLPDPRFPNAISLRGVETKNETDRFHYEIYYHNETFLQSIYSDIVGGCLPMMSSLKGTILEHGVDKNGTTTNVTYSLELVQPFDPSDIGPFSPKACQVVKYTLKNPYCGHPLLKFYQNATICVPYPVIKDLPAPWYAYSFFVCPFIIYWVRRLLEYQGKVKPFKLEKGEKVKFPFCCTSHDLDKKAPYCCFLQEGWMEKIPYCCVLVDLMSISLSVIFTRIQMDAVLNWVFIVISFLSFLDVHSWITGIGAIASLLSNIILPIVIVAQTGDMFVGISLGLLIVECLIIALFYLNNKIKPEQIPIFVTIISIISLIIVCITNTKDYLYILAGAFGMVAVCFIVNGAQFLCSGDIKFPVSPLHTSNFFLVLCTFLPLFGVSGDFNDQTLESFFINTFPIFSIAAAIVGQYITGINQTYRDMAKKLKHPCKPPCPKRTFVPIPQVAANNAVVMTYPDYQQQQYQVQAVYAYNIPNQSQYQYQYQ